MWKVIILMSLLVVCCYCIERNESLAEESRATKKKKKTSARLIAMILLFIFSKVAVFKAVSVYLLMAFFQKLFYIGGLLLNFFLKTKMGKPSAVYGPPQDYNTVGYSYGPPEVESFNQQAPYPGSDLVSGFDWLVNKNVK